ncbi:MAG: hypothetical protein ABSD28_13675 [Tepidisphaeraceae bacterium]|jgi:hypothetical protein
MNVVKIKLRDGSREIELEGPRADVDALLKTWWQDEPFEHSASGNSDKPGAPKPASRRPPSSRAGSPRSTSHGKAPPFDPQPIVNRMRDHPDFQIWEEKVLHQRNAIKKIKLVAWFSKEPQTTGEFHAILQGLGVKANQGNVSNSVKAAISDFLQDGTRTRGAVVRYKLTSNAEKEFGAWLKKNE